MQLGPGVQYNTPYRRDGIIPEKIHQLFVEHVEGVQHSLYLQSLNYVMLSMRPHPATTMLPTYGEMPPISEIYAPFIDDNMEEQAKNSIRDIFEIFTLPFIRGPMGRENMMGYYLTREFQLFWYKYYEDPNEYRRNGFRSQFFMFVSNNLDYLNCVEYEKYMKKIKLQNYKNM